MFWSSASFAATSSDVRSAVAGNVLRLDVVQPERRPGRREVPLDVGPLTLRLLRIDREPLNDLRPDRAGEERGQDPDAHRRERERDPPHPDVHEEQDRRQDRDDREQPQSRELRMHIRIARSRHDPALREVEGERAQVVLVRLDQSEKAEQHRDVSQRRTV